MPSLPKKMLGVPLKSFFARDLTGKNWDELWVHDGEGSTASGAQFDFPVPTDHRPHQSPLTSNMNNQEAGQQNEPKIVFGYAACG